MKSERISISSNGSLHNDEFPEGWKEVKFFDFCILQRGYDLPIAKSIEGPYPIVTSAGIVAYHNESKAKGPGVCTGRSGSIGNVFYIENDFWPHNTSLYVKDFKGNSQKFVYYYLRYFDPSKYSASTAVPTMNRNNLRDVCVHVPPLAEQKRIVARVEALLTYVNAARDRLTRIPLILKRFRQTVLQLAIEGKLVQHNPSEKLSNNDEFNTLIPSGWKFEAIENLVSRLTNGYVGPTREIYINKGIPYLLARHIKKHKIVFDQRTYISEEFNQKNRKSILKKGDVLVVQSGDIGQTAVVNDDHVGHNCHALIVITPKEDSLDGFYLSIYFSSLTGQEITRQIQTGITLKHLNCKDVKKIIIPLPPLAEQHEIVHRVDSLFAHADAIEQEVVAAMKRVGALEHAVLGKAFWGELVPTEAELVRSIKMPVERV
jgi:type I restriction enzyme S subunit